MQMLISPSRAIEPPERRLCGHSGTSNPRRCTYRTPPSSRYTGTRKVASAVARCAPPTPTMGRSLLTAVPSTRYSSEQNTSRYAPVSRYVEARRRGGGYVERHRRPHVLCQLAHSRLGHEAVRHVVDVQLHPAVRLDDRHRCPVHARRSSCGGRDEVLSQRRSLKTVYARDKTGYGRRQRQRPDDMKRDACGARGEPRRPPHQSRQPHNPTRETSRERESPGQVREVERIGSRQKGGE